MKKYVVNLDRRTDRMAEFKRRCPWDGVERVPAVDAAGIVKIFQDNADFILNTRR